MIQWQTKFDDARNAATAAKKTLYIDFFSPT